VRKKITANSILLFFLLVFGFRNTAFAYCEELGCWKKNKPCNPKEKSFSDRLSLEINSGYYRIPGKLFSLDKSITKHPSGLTGSIKSVSGSFEITDHWLAGIEGFEIGASGNGEWARSDTAKILADNNLKGVIVGDTYWELKGVIFKSEYQFLTGLFQPFVRFGGGAGELTVRFKGKMIGHETLSGLNFPVMEDASDKITKTIPILLMEAGLRIEPKNHLTFSLSGYINTGYGGRLGIGARF